MRPSNPSRVPVQLPVVLRVRVEGVDPMTVIGCERERGAPAVRVVVDTPCIAPVPLP